MRERPTPLWVKPEREIGGAVAYEALVARSAEAAVGISGLLAYRTGFQFTVTAALRPGRTSEQEWQILHWRGQYDSDTAPERFLSLTIGYSDGRTGSNLDNSQPTVSEPSEIYLEPSGGTGIPTRFDMTYWVWPLPPEGPVTFTCGWPAYDIPTSHVSLDAASILGAADRAVLLWA